MQGNKGNDAWYWYRFVLLLFLFLFLFFLSPCLPQSSPPCIMHNWWLVWSWSWKLHLYYNSLVWWQVEVSRSSPRYHDVYRSAHCENLCRWTLDNLSNNAISVCWLGSLPFIYLVYRFCLCFIAIGCCCYHSHHGRDISNVIDISGCHSILCFDHELDITWNYGIENCGDFTVLFHKSSIHC